MTDNGREIVLPVRFFVDDIERIKVRAAEIDVENQGEAQAEYTDAQALTVVFHNDGVGADVGIGSWSVETPWENLR